MLKNSLLWLTGLGEIGDQLAVLERDGTIIECNRAWCLLADRTLVDQSGWRKGENFLQAFASSRHAPETRASMDRAWTAALAGDKNAGTVSYPGASPDAPRWYNVTFKAFRANGRDYVLVIHADVTAAKQRESASAGQLTASKRLALVAEYTDRAVLILDRKARIVWVNNGFTKLMGYTLEEVSGRKPDVLHGVDTDPSTSAMVEKRLRDGESVDVEILHYTKTGQALWIRSEIRPVREPSARLEYFVALEVDITDMKRMNETLARERQILEAIVNGLPNLIAWKGHDLRFLGCNRQYAQAAGLPSTDAIVGLRARDIESIPRQLHPHEDEHEAIDRQILETGKPVLRLKEKWRLPTGEERVVDVNKMPLRLDSDLVNGILVMSVDVTEEARIADKVRENEERWKRALEVNDVGVWDFDVSLNKVLLSPRWLEMFALDGELPADIAFPEFLIHADDLARYRADWQALLAGNLPALETSLRMRVGPVYRYMKMRGRVVARDSAGRALRVVGTHADIHDARQEQMQSARVRKLEAIGQLAAGIAHEINTPTQFVGDNVRFLSEAFASLRDCIAEIQRICSQQTEVVTTASLHRCLNGADMTYLQEEIPKAIEQSLEGIQRIAKIVAAMKDFSHPGQERVPADINRAIANTIVVATNEWKYVAHVETDLDPELTQVPILPGEFNQVILNIIVNAAHAIDERGSAGVADGRKGTIRVSTRRSGDWAEIAIADDGGGIPPEIQDRIFDPFFTTKPVGKGTGQGLAIAHDVIVSKHGGTIAVRSELGKGTTFILRLPLKLANAAEAAA